MSIYDLLLELNQQQRLFLLEPASSSQSVVRPLLITPGLKSLVDPPINDRCVDLRVDLDRFTSGGPIEWDYLKPLEPRSEEVWEIRSINPSPSLRVFGRFADSDVFVVTHAWPRWRLLGFGSIFWKAEIRRCKHTWNQLFGTLPPHKGTSIHDYVSGAIEDPSAYDR